jgi:hypothetical protein
MPHALVQRNSINLCLPLLRNLDFACRPYPQFVSESHVLHIKFTHFDSVASVVITKVASVACCSQVSQVSGKNTAMMPMLCL